MEKLGYAEKYGKRRQITFRIGPIAQDRLAQAAALFNMNPGEYAKAVLYKDLGVFNEPLDQRRRTWKQRKEKLQELDEEL
jgi:site-specific DNA-adenine methylase